MKHILKISCLFVLLCASLRADLASDAAAVKAQIVTGALAAQVVELGTADFATGTYRIQQPGYYRLMEDVEFNPTSGRADMPLTGWTSIFSVEGDGPFVIDLNGHTLAASDAFMLTKGFYWAYSTVLCGNSIVAYPFGTGVQFADATSYVAGNNLVLRNGTLGTSPAWGFLATNNKNIFLENITVADWYWDGILLSGVNTQGGYCSLDNVTITGLNHNPTFNFQYGSLTLLTFFLNLVTNTLPQIGMGIDYPQGEALLAAMAALLADPTQNGQSNPPTTQTNISSAGVSIDTGIYYFAFPNPTQATGCSNVTSAAHGGVSQNIILNNVSISGITANITDTIGIANRITGLQLPEYFYTVVPGLRWIDAYDPMGLIFLNTPGGSSTFAPNNYLKATVWLIDTIIKLTEQGLMETFGLSVFSIPPTALPAGFADNILSATPNETTFISQVQPVFDFNWYNAIAHHQSPARGPLGVRLFCPQNCMLNEVSVSNINNVSAPGLEVSQVPSIVANYPDLVLPRYTGDDVFGIGMYNGQNNVIQNSTVTDCSSTNGNAYGCAIFNGSSNIQVLNSSVSGLTGQSDIVTGTANQPSYVAGFLSQNNPSTNIQFNNDRVSNLSAPRFVDGFASENSGFDQFNNDVVTNLTATSSTNLNDASVAKRGVGFASRGSQNTLINSSASSAVQIIGEGAATTQSLSVAVGYLLTNGDANAAICNCITRGNHSGAGKAVGVFIESANQASIRKNEGSYNIADVSFAQGIGFQNRGSSTRLTQNLAYANSTQNYDAPGALIIETSLANLRNITGSSQANISITDPLSTFNAQTLAPLTIQP